MPEYVGSLGASWHAGAWGLRARGMAPASWDLQPSPRQVAKTGTCHVPAVEAGSVVRRLAGEGAQWATAGAGSQHSNPEGTCLNWLPRQGCPASQPLARAAGPDTPPLRYQCWSSGGQSVPWVSRSLSVLADGQGSQGPGLAIPACTLQDQGRGHSVWLNGLGWR